MFLSFSSNLWAQDERLMREILEFKLPEKVDNIMNTKRRKAMSPFYFVDLNKDRVVAKGKAKISVSEARLQAL